MEKALLVPLSSTTHGRDVSEIYKYHMELLRDLCYETLPLITRVSDIEKFQERVSEAHVILALACTGGTKRLILHLTKFDKPIIIISHPTQNSLASAIHALTILRKRNYPAMIFHNVSEKNLPDLKKAIRVADAVYSLRNKTVLLLGISREWLEEEEYDLSRLERLLHINLQILDLETLVKEFQTSKPDEEVLRKFSKFKAKEITEEDIMESSRVYTLVKRLIDKYGAIAYGIRCFPFVLQTNVTPCLAVSHSIDKGIIAACEADLGALISMMLASAVTHQPVFMGNIEDIDENNLVIAHCTIATSLTDDLVLRSHFETGKSVGIAGIIQKNEQVTLIRISNDFLRMLIISGKVIEGTPWSENFCRTQLRIRTKEPVNHLTEDPVGSHLVIIRGDYREDLVILARLLDLQINTV